jgi:hypothetical protein
MKITSVFPTVILSLLAGCGMSESSPDKGAELAYVEGTGCHQISGTNVLLRSADLGTVVGRADAGIEVWPTGARQQGNPTGTNHTYYEVWVTSMQRYAWLANGTWVRPCNSNPPPMNDDITEVPGGSEWRIITNEDNGGLNCRVGPGSNNSVLAVIAYGTLVFSQAGAVGYDGAGKPWMQVLFSRTGNGDMSPCWLRATRSRVELVRIY